LPSIVDLLRPGAVLPIRLAEVIVARTRGEDEIVIWHPAVFEQHGLALPVDAGNAT